MPSMKVALLVLFFAIAIYSISKFFNNEPTPRAEGTFHTKFRNVATAFRSLFEDGLERGAAFAVYYKGQYLVDMWGGFSDEGIKLRWKEDTIARAMSMTKCVAGVIAALMVDRGWLDYKKPVSFYWPGFDRNGKENVTVEMLLSHTAGLPVLSETISMLTIKSDPEKIEKLLEEQRPIWPPGTAHGYHGITYGLYVDTLLRKADPKHRIISEIFKEEIADPHGIDFFIGLPKSENYRMARFRDVPFWDQITKFNFLGYPEILPAIYDFLIDSNSLLAKSFQAIEEHGEVWEHPDVREIPFSTHNGFGSARALAKLMGMLAKKDGSNFIKPSTINEFQKDRATGEDRVVRINRTYGAGVHTWYNSQGYRVFGHLGMGGQLTYADPQNELGFAFFTNYLSFLDFNDRRFSVLEKPLYAALSSFV